MPSTPRSPSPERLTFGSRLRAERHKKGLTLEDVADAADMNWSYIAGLERGERNVAIDNMAALAAAVGLPLWELLCPQLPEEGAEPFGP